MDIVQNTIENPTEIRLHSTFSCFSSRAILALRFNSFRPELVLQKQQIVGRKLFNQPFQGSPPARADPSGDRNCAEDPWIIGLHIKEQCKWLASSDR